MKIGHGLGRKGNWLARRVMRRLGRRGEEGAAVLEIAITLPLLMTVLTGTVSFSLALYFLLQVGNATSSEAQMLAGSAGSHTDPCAVIGSQLAASLPGLNPAKLTFTVVITTASGTTTYGPFNPPSSGTCTAAGNGGAASTQEVANYPVTVTVTYAYPWFPIVGFSPSSSLTSTETQLAE